jgi:hypothetical protein
VPKGVTICNVFGHEPAIAEYVLMTMLVLTHRLFESVMAFRMGSWVASPQFGGGSPHGEVLGRTIGIIGYGRIGREVAERAAGLKCRVLAANRRPVADPTPSETVFPLTDLDRMPPLCDTILIACALAPETAGLIDARRLALMKPGTLLINARRSRLPSARRRSPPAAIGQPTTGAPGSGGDLRGGQPFIRGAVVARGGDRRARPDTRLLARAGDRAGSPPQNSGPQAGKPPARRYRPRWKASRRRRTRA